jgi:DNA repair protein RecN (Recombination protein N)
MLRFLRIQRLAVIDAVEVEFDPGLNVLTGETGAGKSILVGAVGLLLGGRASGDMVRTGEEHATVEAIFESGGEELVVRREISASGRSRAFVNGELATASALKELSARLIELHGQHEHQTLLEPASHAGVLDSVAKVEPLLEKTAIAFKMRRDASDELTRMRALVAERGARQDLAAFQLAELDRAALQDQNEDATLSATRKVLTSSERVRELCEASYAALYERDDAILASLGAVWRRVGELAALDPAFQQYVDARPGIKSELEDLAMFLRRYADGVDASTSRLQEVEERLALLERLKRKYGPTLADVIVKRDALRGEMADLENGDERIGALERAQQAAHAGFVADARALSSARRSAASRFSRSLEKTLGELAMERTRFEVRFTDLTEDAWTAAGIDGVEFFVSPNPGEDLRPLARIVSGGELSRIMLAIKTLLAETRHGWSESRDRASSAAPPGLIFDEVDAGIGGRVADVVGEKLRVLGSAFQVLCITHLPQIAAYADSHFEIEKHIERGRTLTTVKRLDAAERIEEISRMLGGASLTDGIRASAREMLNKRRQAKGESERAKVDRRKPSRTS